MKFDLTPTPAPTPQETNINQAVSYLKRTTWTTENLLMSEYNLTATDLNKVLSHFPDHRRNMGVIHT